MAQLAQPKSLVGEGNHRQITSKQVWYWLQSTVIPARSSEKYDTNIVALAHLCALVGDMEDIDNRLHSIFVRPRHKPAFASVDVITGLAAAAASLHDQSGNGWADAAIHYINALNDIPAENRGANAAFIAIALGDDREIERISSNESLANLDWARLLRTGTPSDTRLVLTIIENASCFGRFRPSCDELLPLLLDGAAMACLRRYDLLLAMRIMRARNYVAGNSGLASTMGLQFLILNQCSDGSFGDYETAIRRQSSDEDFFFRLKLPLAFQALWTIAECAEVDYFIVEKFFGRKMLT